MNASDTSPRKGHECDGVSDLEQRVLREILRSRTDLIADELRYRSGDDLDEQLRDVRKARAELAVTARLLEQYVEGTGGEE